MWGWMLCKKGILFWFFFFFLIHLSIFSAHPNSSWSPRLPSRCIPWWLLLMMPRNRCCTVTRYAAMQFIATCGKACSRDFSSRYMVLKTDEKRLSGTVVSCTARQVWRVCMDCFGWMSFWNRKVNKLWQMLDTLPPPPLGKFAHYIKCYTLKYFSTSIDANSSY